MQTLQIFLSQSSYDASGNDSKGDAFIEIDRIEYQN